MSAKTKTKTKQKKNSSHWNKEEAAKMGKIGGKVMTEKRRIANSIRSIKTGEQSKNEWVMKVTTPTPLDRMAGITRKDKIRLLKKIAPALATSKIEVALMEYGMTLAEMRQELFRLERLYAKYSKSSTEKIRASNTLLHWKMQYANKEWEFIRDVFGVGKPNFELSAKSESTRVTMQTILTKILGEPDGDGNSDLRELV